MFRCILTADSSFVFPSPQTRQELSRDLPQQYGFILLGGKIIQQFNGLGSLRRFIGINEIDQHIRVNGVHEVLPVNIAARQRGWDVPR